MSPALVPVNVPGAVAELSVKVPALFVPNPKTAERFFDFFTSHIRNKNTRRAYYNAVCQFSEWCKGRGLHDLSQVKPFHVAGYIEMLGVPVRDGPGFPSLP